MVRQAQDLRDQLLARMTHDYQALCKQWVECRTILIFFGSVHMKQVQSSGVKSILK
jgi:hypothetical protein